jgi:glycosyltransferase involved in cell wall biosynthesis
MKILSVSLPDLRRIYPQRYHQLLKHLSEKHEVQVLCIRAWGPDQIRDEYLDNCLRNVDIIYPSSRQTNSLVQDMQLATKSVADLKIKKDFDVLLNFNDLIGAYFIRRRLELPMVFDICDDLPNYVGQSSQVPGLLRSFGQRLGHLMLKKNLRASARITYTTEFLQKTYGFEKNKSTRIPNGVDLELFRPLQVPQNHGNASVPEFTMGFVGFLGPWIDFITPLRCLRDLVDENYCIKAVVVGTGPELPRLKEAAARLRVSDRVIFAGNVRYTEIPACISRMDVCLLPFKKDAVSEHALPLKLFEYLACEKPVISTELSGVVQAAGDSILYASSEEELKHQLIKLFEDEALRTTMGRRGKEIVRAGYSWSSISTRFEEVVQEAAR